MPSSGILHHVTFVRTEVSGECTLVMVVLRFSLTSILSTVTWCNIPEDGILHNLSDCTSVLKVTPAIVTIQVTKKHPTCKDINDMNSLSN
jgi:hypothetical protein